MKLHRIDVFNFRLLKKVSINLSPATSTTILVGPNNSGKTSVAEALLLFAGDGRKHFTIHDFSVACFADFIEAEKLFLAKKDDMAAGEKLPKIWLDLYLEYADKGADLAVASDLLMDLDPKLKEVGLRVEFAVADPIKLAEDFRNSKKEKQTLQDFLGRNLGDYFTIRYFKIDSQGVEAVALDGKSVLDRVIRVDFVFAQRHMDDQESSRATRLSHLLHAHYEKHYKSAEPENHQKIEETLDGHAKELGGKYMKAFDGLIKSLKQFGYPQQKAPEMSIRAELNSTTLFKDHTRIFYGMPKEEKKEGGGEEKAEKLLVDLPEKYNGLGLIAATYESRRGSREESLKREIMLRLQLDSHEIGFFGTVARYAKMLLQREPESPWTRDSDG